MAARARREKNRPLEQVAEQQQRSWQCPSAGHAGHTDDATASTVLDVFAELTSVERRRLHTCPRWHATQPEITRAVTYRRYVEAGCPDSIDADPPVALIRAAHLVAAADGDRLRAEQEEREAKRGR